MKNFYVLGLALFSTIAISQEKISFEISEGYELGTLHNQNGWTVTEGIDGIITNQILTDETASDGTISFKNGDEPDFDFQWFPIFGAALEFETPYPNDKFSISYDVKVTEKMGADFEFTLFGKDELDEYYPIAGVGMEFQGNIYVIKSVDYDYDIAEGATWTENEWQNIRIEIEGSELKYYLNDALIYTGENYNPMEVAGFNMLHNNYGGSAYYDNFVITSGEEEMSVTDLATTSLNIYPNPVRESLSIQLNKNEKITSAEVYSLTGQKVKSVQNSSNISLIELAQGTYILKVTTENGKTYTKKFVKI